MQSHLKPGDIILPQVAICREGVAQLYGAIDSVAGSSTWLTRAEQTLKQHNHQTYSGTHLTWPSLFGQNGKMIETWHRAGYLSVDMETATTYAVAEYFQMSAISMLVVWDDLTRGKSFLDPLSKAEQAALDRANGSVFEAALSLTGYLQ